MKIPFTPQVPGRKPTQARMSGILRRVFRVNYELLATRRPSKTATFQPKTNLVYYDTISLRPVPHLTPITLTAGEVVQGKRLFDRHNTDQMLPDKYIGLQNPGILGFPRFVCVQWQRSA
jgi:hypothetical protein